MLGLKEGTVRLDDYSASWDDLYQQEAERIRTALGDLAIGVEHVGSTAIPGIKAKPILDIAVGVRRLEDSARCKEPLEGLGYQWVHWIVLEDDHIFGKGGETQTHLVHIVEYESDKWREYLKFRDTLRADPAMARAYEELKRELSEKFSDKRSGYTAAKAAFIRQVLGA